MKNLILFSLLTFTIFSNAQVLEIKETFDSNTLGWNELIDKKGESVIVDGVLQLTSKNEDGFYESHCYTDINPKANFEISCEVNVKTINDDNTFGLIFDYIDDGNFMVLVISEGNAALLKKKDGEFVGAVRNSIKLKKARKTNVDISLKHELGTIICEVNGIFALQAKYIEMTSGGIGFYVAGKQKLQFDNLTIIQ